VVGCAIRPLCSSWEPFKSSSRCRRPHHRPTPLRQVLEVLVKDSHMTGRTNLGKATFPLK